MRLTTATPFSRVTNAVTIGVVAVLGLVVSSAFTPVASTAASAVTIVVSSTQDVVNGDTSSVSALVADPGPDGISLREAIEATNASPGTYVIDFAPSLAGATLSLLSQLPALTGGGVTINRRCHGRRQTRRDDCPRGEFHRWELHQQRRLRIHDCVKLDTLNAMTLSGIR